MVARRRPHWRKTPRWYRWRDAVGSVGLLLLAFAVGWLMMAILGGH